VNIKVLRDTGHTALTGGEYAIPSLEIHVDKRLSKRIKTERIIHAIVEWYLPIIEHDKIDEISEAILDALDQLKDLEKKKG